MQRVMPAEARPGGIVDGLVGNRFVGITPTPFLPEKLRERPRVDAARVADVHDVAPRLGHGQHGPLVDGERGGCLLACRACRAVPAWKSNFGRPTPSTRRCPTQSRTRCILRGPIRLRSPCIPLENRNPLFHSLPLGFTKRSRPVGALFTAHQHEIKPGLDFCSLLTFNDGAARRQDLELCWSRFV